MAKRFCRIPESAEGRNCNYPTICNQPKLFGMQWLNKVKTLVFFLLHLRRTKVIQQSTFLSDFAPRYLKYRAQKQCRPALHRNSATTLHFSEAAAINSGFAVAP